MYGSATKVKSCSFVMSVSFVLFGCVDNQSDPERQAELGQSEGARAGGPSLSVDGCFDEGNGANENAYCFEPIKIDASGLLKIARDFDSDDNLDLAIVDEGAGTLRVLFGDGRGTFESVSSITLPGSPFRAPYFDPAFFVFDQDGDGALDLGLSFPASKELWVAVNIGARQFALERRPVLRLGSSAPLAVDADGDGDDDLVFGGGVGSTESRLDLLESSQGAHSYSASSPPAAWSMVTAIAQSEPLLTVDGSLSDTSVILAAGTWAGIRDETPILGFGLHGGALELVGPLFLAGVDPYWLFTEDLDGDGLTEAIVGNRASADFSVARRNSTSGEDALGWVADERLAVGAESLCVEHGCTSMAGAAAGDFDGDGRSELLASMNREHGEARLYIVDVDEPGLTWIADAGYYPATGDFNEDGVDDIAFSHPDGVRILISRP
jgi:hypothetical protein